MRMPVPDLRGAGTLQMAKGDPGMEDVYQWTVKQINVPFRGRTGTSKSLRFGLLRIYHSLLSIEEPHELHT
jgi:hypothetical protein